MSKSIIKYLILAVATVGMAQEKKSVDSITIKERYGLRIAIDLSKPARSLFENGYNGLELGADYRISKKWYAAASVGTEDRNKHEDLYQMQTKGWFARAGVDINTYDNTHGTDHNIYFGFRYAVTKYSQELLDYSIFNNNTYFREEETALDRNQALGKQENLNAGWIETIVGAKVQLFTHVYLGASIRINFLLHQDDTNNLPNNWIPGFQKITDGSNWGMTFNYTLAYRIPLLVKDKKVKAY
ncbi:MAG: DUF6048 family protein [Flavobacteriaceae bacterium]|nr:DUF6048 family protein [Flavobacteriaceae bacterium]